MLANIDRPIFTVSLVDSWILVVAFKGLLCKLICWKILRQTPFIYCDWPDLIDLDLIIIKQLLF